MRKTLLIPDVHFPKENKRQVKVLMRLMRQWEPDHLVFLGDLDDMEAPSRWVQGTPDEWKSRISISSMPTTAKFLADVRDILPDAQIDYMSGNHEARVQKYIETKAPAFDGLITISKLFDLDNLGITFYPYNLPPQKLVGPFYVHHGNVVNKDSSFTAKGELRANGVSGITAHTHRLGVYHETRLDGTVVSWYEAGHVSNPKKQIYGSAHHNWQSGFMIVYDDGKHYFPSTVPFPHNGNDCVVDGILLKG